MLTTYIFAGILVAIIGTPALMRLGAWRSGKQPLLCYPDSEILLLRTLVQRPSEAVLVLNLETDHFVDADRGSLWLELKNYCLSYVVHSDETTQEQTLLNKEVVAKNATGSLLDRLTPTARRTVAAIHNQTEILSEEEVVASAQKIYLSGVDRTYYAGNSKVIRTGQASAPLVRETSKPTMLQTLLYFCALLIGTVVCLSVGFMENNSMVAVAYSAGMLLLLSGSIVWTIVDLDTLYIDMPTLVAFGAGAWSCTVVGATIAGTLSNVLLGFVATLIVGGFIFVVGILHTKLRGKPGMGGGDYMLMLVTIGVPVAVTGVWAMANWILLVSLLLGIVGWLVRYLKVDGFDKNTPYAFGPYLACGWFVTLGLWRIVL